MPNTLNPTQQDLLEQLLEQNVRPRLDELVKAARANDSKSPLKTYTNPLFANYNLLTLIKFLQAIISKTITLEDFKGSLHQTYGPTEPSTSVLLALYHHVNNTTEPLKGSYAETICDPRLYTDTGKTVEQQIHQNLLVVSGAVHSEIYRTIRAVLKAISVSKPSVNLTTAALHTIRS